MENNADFVIKAAPELIEKAALDSKRIFDEISFYLDSVCEDTAALIECWNSDSADVFRRVYTEEFKAFQDTKAMMSRQQDILSRIAGIYKITEQSAANAASELPENVFE